MNIYAKSGDKVIFKHPNAGRESDQETARKNLVPNQTYTVDRTKVHDWHTDVFLREVPGVRFNSVHFEDA